MSFNIAIDGPAGAGKSTIAKLAAKELGFIYIDTGAMYRTIALYLLREHVDCEDEQALEAALRRIEVEIGYSGGVQQLILNGENVTDLIRTEEVSQMASISSAKPSVRQKLLQLQRGAAEKYNVIMDGRDIGTVILPDAQLKIYLTASIEERARRRYAEMKAKGVECDLSEIEADIAQRDERDMNREVSPLKQAEDAVLIDSSNMTIEEVCEKICALAKRAGA